MGAARAGDGDTRDSERRTLSLHPNPSEIIVLFRVRSSSELVWNDPVPGFKDACHPTVPDLRIKSRFKAILPKDL